MLSIFNISNSGVEFYKTSLDAIAYNVANLSTVRSMSEGAVRVTLHRALKALAVLYRRDRS